MNEGESGMRMNGKRALLLALIAVSTACSDSHGPCGSQGTFASDAESAYCVYARSQSIVIEGGFGCPAAMQFEFEAGSHRVCSDHPLDPMRLPPGLCAQGVCSQEDRPREPQPGTDPDPEPEPSDEPVVSATDRTPEDVRDWPTCDSDALEMGLNGDRCGGDEGF